MKCKNNLLPLLYIFFNFCFITANGQLHNVKQLEATVKRIAEEEEIAGGTLSVAVFDVASGNQIYGFNDNKLLSPASILKVVTSAVALDQFEPDFKFKTTLGYNGTIENGTLYGDLVIKGYGDPTFGTGRFGEDYHYKSILKKITESLISKQINTIKGDIVVDASHYNTQLISPKWLWEDIGNYYGAGAGGFNFNENMYEIYFKSGREWEETEIAATKPDFINVDLVNEVVAGTPNSGDNAYVFGAPLTKKQYIRGTIPPYEDKFKIKAALPNPALTFAGLLKEHLSNTGIFCQGVAKDHYSSTNGVPFKQIITQFYSPPLIQIINETHKKSINIYAEAILKLLSSSCSINNTDGNSLNSVANYLKNRNFKNNNFIIYDGSGLSPLNKITTQLMSQLLSQIANKPNFDQFYNTLSIAGNSANGNSLKNMLKGSIAANNLRAKSGYITGVRSYTGYVQDQSNRMLSFTAIANNYTCTNSKMRSFLEEILLEIASIN